MLAIFKTHTRTRIFSPSITFKRIVGWGLISGLAATAVMDAVLIGILAAASISPFTCFTIVGDTIIKLFSVQAPGDSVAVGVIAHYLVGPALGVLLGAAPRYFPGLRARSWKKVILFAVLYAEILSQPLLAMTPLVLRMTISETLLWFGGSFGMHLIWGCAYGAIWRLGLQQPGAEERQSTVSFNKRCIY